MLAPQPSAKRRRSLLGAVAVKQAGEVVVQDEDTSLLDLKVSAEIEKFEQLRCKTLAKGLDGHTTTSTRPASTCAHSGQITRRSCLLTTLSTWPRSVARRRLLPT